MKSGVKFPSSPGRPRPGRGLVTAQRARTRPHSSDHMRAARPRRRLENAVIFAARVIAVALLLFGPAAHAQGPVASPSQACLERPTQPCLLAEAFELLQLPTSVILFPSGARKYDLEKIVELHANAGRFAEARRVADAIGSREISRVHALRSIGLAQASAGASQNAADSFDQAHQLIDARDNDPLGQAGLLLAMAKAEDEAGL